MSTVRQRIVDAIKVRLGGIALQNGYGTDAGLNVYEWRDNSGEPIQENELPCITVRDESGQINKLDFDTSEHSLTVDVHALDRGDDAPALARRLEADVLVAFGVDPTFGGLCHYCQAVNSMVEVKQTGKRSAGVRISFDIKFRVKSWDPSTPVPYPT